MRKAACDYLDIQPSELRLGVRAITRNQEPPTFEVYLVDALENGAGYCQYLAAENRMLTEVLLPLRDGQLAAASILREDHVNGCDASCPDCLREFGNSEYHPLLDWRLAFDLLNLAINADTEINLSGRYWQGLAVSATQQFASLVGGQVSSSDRLDLGFAGKVLTVTHPLLASSRNDANCINLFELIRRPGKVITEIGGG